MTQGSAKPPFDDSTPEGELLRTFLDQGRKVTRRITDVAGFPAGPEILAQDPELRARLAALVSHVLAQGNQQRTGQTRSVTRIGGATITSYDPRGLKKTVGWTHRQGLMMKALMSRLLRSRLPFDEAQLAAMVEDLSSEEAWNWEVPVTSVIAAVERYAREQSLSDRLRRALVSLRRLPEEKGWIAIPKTVRERLEQLLQASASR